MYAEHVGLNGNLTVCDTSTVSKVDFESELAPTETEQSQSSPISPSCPSSRLNRFLNELGIRPNDSPPDLDEPSLHSNVFARGLPSGSSLPPLSSLMAASTVRNPEADSFAYMETLLESLAVLGKLGNALDVVSQRLPGEIFNLVETTLDEVGERAEYNRRGSIFAGAGSAKSEGIYTYSSDPTSGLDVNQGTLLNSSCLRLAALESSAKQVDHEILSDFFWTVYSKLDAISQGLRLVYEVANRIGSVSFNTMIPAIQSITSSPPANELLYVTETGFQGLIWSKTWSPLPTCRNLVTRTS